MTDKKIFIIVGMAGSGKTTFAQRFYSWISADEFVHDKESGLNANIFSLNLDPATLNPKMPLNEDIRDIIDYEKVMEDHNLGPNGAITTSLNLYMLTFDKLLTKIHHKYVIIDTPGQIEAITWSGAGFALTDFLKSLKDYELNILFVIDSVVSQSPSVFISNMLYAANIECRFKIKVHCVFNKSDLEKNDTLVKYMRDYEFFRESLDDNEMYSPMLNSLALYFEEFYNKMSCCAVSSTLGTGKKELFEMIGINKQKIEEKLKDLKIDTEVEK